jgi:pimeloyl-ACP methyl ester carboxylesterase
MAKQEVVALPGGRQIEVWLTEHAGDRTLVYFEGTPMAGPPERAVARAAERSGLRIVSIIRPGYATSTRLPGRSVADVVPDTEEVLSHLGVGDCVVAGWSGGGPHALACAARLPQARAVACIAGVAPYGVEGLDFLAGMGEDNVEEFTVALAGEEQLRSFVEAAAAVMKDLQPSQLVEAMASLLPQSDLDVLDDDHAADLASGFRAAVRNGVDGWLDDDLAFTRPWGFDLGEISVPTFIWQGDADLMVPFGHGRWLASKLPGAVTHFTEGAGHVSIALPVLDELFGELIEAAGW